MSGAAGDLAALVDPRGMPATPTPAQAAITDAPRALEIVRLAVEHRVATLLARRLAQTDVLGGWPPAARGALREAVMRAQHARAVYDGVLVATGAALDGAGVPWVALKGAALGLAVYREPVLRPVGDIDVLVQPADLDRALAALDAAGFRRPSETNQQFWREAYYNLPLTAPGDSNAKLELHWSIAQPRRHTPDVAGIVARARRIQVAWGSVPVPAPIDLFLHQALHLGYHYFEARLMWLVDIAWLLQDPPDAAAVADRAREWGMSTVLALVLQQVDRAFPGVLGARFAALARANARARWIVRRWPPSQPYEVIGGWDRRGRQLVLGLLTVDDPLRGAAATLSYLGRALRHGDRSGRRSERGL